MAPFPITTRRTFLKAASAGTLSLLPLTWPLMIAAPKRITRPDGAVLVLAGDDAGFMTGSTLTVNGGQYHA